MRKAPPVWKSNSQVSEKKNQPNHHKSNTSYDLLLYRGQNVLSTHSATQLILNELSFLLPHKLIFLLFRKTHPELLYLQLIFAQLHRVEENNAKNIWRYLFLTLPAYGWGQKVRHTYSNQIMGKKPTQTKPSQQRRKTEERTIQGFFIFENPLLCQINGFSLWSGLLLVCLNLSHRKKGEKDFLIGILES